MSGEMVLPADFASELIHWQRRHGRRGLPWQGTRDPYQVWLSEIMLQQTQVVTVLGYYDRFLARFPDVRVLAAASPDEVMALWSGLGYYSRARNLHRCAQVVVQDWGGRFPESAAQLAGLPGIGDSTAAAIAAFCYGERVSIVDGNVRRVLSRVLSFDQDLATAPAQRALWDVAQRLLPQQPSQDDMVAYTQGLMDLGAMLCTRSRPACNRCPMANICTAHQQGAVDRFPFKSRRLVRRHEAWWLLVLRRPGTAAAEPAVWLERRPARGIWAGLHCVPVFTDEASACAYWGGDEQALHPLPAVVHALTHKELRLHPLLVDMTEDTSARFTDEAGAWWPVGRLDGVGLPAPVRTLLSALPS